MKPKLSAALALAAAAAVLLPPDAAAHRSWLLPSATLVDGREPWVTVDAAVSENLFDFGANALKLDGLTVTGPDGTAVAPENVFTGRLRSSFDLKLARPGSYRLSLVAESVIASYRLNGEPKRWRGAPEALAAALPAGAEDVRTTRQHNRLEAFVTSGRPDRGAFATSGSGLELVPLTHPNELAAGTRAEFRFLLDGKPAANLPFSVIPGGVRWRGVLNEQRLVTDADGRASVRWPGPGLYWISASFPAGGGGPQAQPVERRTSYAATVEVSAE